MRYEGYEKEMQNLKEYLEIDHLSPNSPDKSQQIMNFYTKETFYYGLTNSILRVSRCPDSFRPITIPFNENYHAIKNFYLAYKEQVGTGPGIKPG